MGHFAYFERDVAQARQEAEQSARARGDRSYKFNPKETWLAYGQRVGCKELAFVAACLLSINCSEACVERSFSLQKLHHSQLTNRSSLDLVQSKLAYQINAAALKNVQTRSMYNIELLQLLGEQEAEPGDVVQQGHGDMEEEKGQAAQEEEEQAAEAEAAEVDDGGIDVLLQTDPVADLEVALDQQEAEVALDQQEAVVVPLHSYAYEPVFTDRMSAFATAYINKMQLQKEKTWSKRGSAAALREALLDSDDPLMKKEMPDVVQRCIKFLLHS